MSSAYQRYSCGINTAIQNLKFMIQKYLSVLAFCMLTFGGFAQNRNSVVVDSLQSSSFLAKGCEKFLMSDLCTKQRLNDIVFNAINNEQDIQNIHANREQLSNSFINIKTRVCFDADRNLIEEKSFIKVLDKDGKEFLGFKLSFSVRDLPLLAPSPTLAKEETHLESLLQCILEQKPLGLRQMPVFNEKLQTEFLEEKKQYAIYEGCENNTTYESQRRCFGQKINKFVTQRFNRNVVEGTGLSGQVRIFTRFKISKDGSIIDVACRAPHPRLKAEMLRIFKLLPRVKPGTINGEAVDIIYTFPVIFTI